MKVKVTTGRPQVALQKLLTLASLVLLIIVFAVISRPNTFFTGVNIVAIMQATAVTGVLALGATFVIITGGIDLSVGTVMTFSAVIGGLVITNMGLPVWAGIIAALLAGAVTGGITGTFVSRLGIPPFIATLGMMMITRGLNLVLTGTRPIYFAPELLYSNISNGTAIDLNIISKGLQVPTSVLILFVAAIIAHTLLSRTIFGRYTYAIGSNGEAARLSGINVANWKTGIYALCGTFAAVAGILMSARLNSVQPALGAGYEMDAFAAVVIGGTSLSGGEGTITGTIIGAFIMSVLTNGLRINSVPQEWQTVIIGVVVITAVYIDILNWRRKRG